MTSEEIFIWIYLPDAVDPVVAGRLSVAFAGDRKVGQFVYGRSYLSNPAAIPLDPVSLPLAGRIDPTTTLNGFPGVIMDASPDKWGMRAITRLLGQQSVPSGYLLVNDPGRAGCLAFSTSSRVPPVELRSREFSLGELLRAAEALEQDREVDPELIRALHPGTGGARPKCNVLADGAVWIAKFPSSDDPAWVSIPRLEYAAMQLARACGIHVAETRLEEIDGKDVCLVRRFDRVVKANGEMTRLGFLSARSVFFDDPGFFPNGAIGSYPRLARWLPRFAPSLEDSRELFRRMVFNAAIRNTDDHELNHGLVYDPLTQAYRLSPAYDLVPGLARHAVSQHALLIGDTADGTRENLVSACSAFGLGRQAALEVIEDVTAAVQRNWDSAMYAAGFDQEVIGRISHCFDPLPYARMAPEPAR